ncbi:hypothetical protein DPMN_040726 [Dreissena polymorpha]|uniref:Uncharacterized protein n=1 Tax=Dreissena polymorpha TaxID=45954 RepID=A0A9D4HVB4_DREPO|nr:hypothetical protein DPMN_040726 [Dreissena polymorpha]
MTFHINIRFKGVKLNAEPAQHPSATFQISIRLIRVMANAESAQHSSATFQISIRLKVLRRMLSNHSTSARHSRSAFV